MHGKKILPCTHDASRKASGALEKTTWKNTFSTKPLKLSSKLCFLSNCYFNFNGYSHAHARKRLFFQIKTSLNARSVENRVAITHITATATQKIPFYIKYKMRSSQSLYFYGYRIEIIPKKRTLKPLHPLKNTLFIQNQIFLKRLYLFQR